MRKNIKSAKMSENFQSDIEYHINKLLKDDPYVGRRLAHLAEGQYKESIDNILNEEECLECYSMNVE